MRTKYMLKFIKITSIFLLILFFKTTSYSQQNNECKLFSFYLPTGYSSGQFAPLKQSFESYEGVFLCKIEENTAQVLVYAQSTFTKKEIIDILKINKIKISNVDEQISSTEVFRAQDADKSATRNKIEQNEKVDIKNNIKRNEVKKTNIK